MTTSTKRAPKKLPTVEQADAAYDAALAREASSEELERLSDAIEQAKAREKDDAKATATTTTTAVKVRQDQARIAEDRRRQAGLDAGKRVDTGSFCVMVENRPLAFVHVVPSVSLPGFERVDHERARNALGVLWGLVERYAHARVVNARATAMGLAPDLPASREHLVDRIKWDLKDALATGVVELA